MKNRRFAGSIPAILLLAAVFSTQGQSVEQDTVAAKDSVQFFLWIEYCGSSYNQQLRRQEYVIRAVKLPESLREKMPELKGDGLYSSKNMRILEKQQKVVSRYRGNALEVKVDRTMFRSFYPRGLRKGNLIGIDEYLRWDFFEKPAPAPPPMQEEPVPSPFRNFQRTDPVNPRFGLIRLT